MATVLRYFYKLSLCLITLVFSGMTIILDQS